MDMAQYLTEIDFAAEHLIEAITGEVKRYEGLEKSVRKLTRLVENEYVAAESIKESAEDPEDFMMGVGRYWETYFGPDKELHGKKEALEEARQLLDLHRFSLASLAGDLLQHAKQGISIVHSDLKKCPNGRACGSQSLKDVIWQGRNQALHWEEGDFKPPVQRCFEALEKDFGKKFAEYKTRNMAYDVVMLLGWKDMVTFKADLSSLA